MTSSDARKGVYCKTENFQGIIPYILYAQTTYSGQHILLDPFYYTPELLDMISDTRLFNSSWKEIRVTLVVFQSLLNILSDT